MTKALRALAVALVGVLVAALPAHAGEPTMRTWHGNQIHLYGSQAAGKSGSGIIVAVLDGWVDRSHPDFEGRVLAGADCRNGACKAGMTVENCGAHHGTHVAGTVGASNLGVAPRSTILPVQVLSSDAQGECTGTPAGVAAGIRYAIGAGAKVINLSLGPDNPGSTNAAIPTAVHEAAEAGIVVVFSAGNADLPITQSYGDDALVVAAVGPTGRLASYSQYGAGVSVAAPGGQPDASDNCEIPTCILSLYPGNQIAVAAGTSMAAPHVSGLAALLFAQSPGRSRATVISRIESTAHPISGAGHGLIDVQRALGVTLPSPTKKPATPTTKPTKKSVVQPSRTAAPSPTAPPTPSPTPTAVATTPPASETPTPEPTLPVALDPPRGSAEEDVPLPLAGGAGLLVLLAASSVVAFGRK